MPTPISTAFNSPLVPKMMRKAKARRISFTQNGTSRQMNNIRAWPPLADWAM
ncbi:hypothetical protein D3C83_300640 [compost metagenome]